MTGEARRIADEYNRVMSARALAETDRETITAIQQATGILISPGGDATLELRSSHHLDRGVHGTTISSLEARAVSAWMQYLAEREHGVVRIEGHRNVAIYTRREGLEAGGIYTFVAAVGRGRAFTRSSMFDPEVDDDGNDADMKAAARAYFEKFPELPWHAAREGEEWMVEFIASGLAGSGNATVGASLTRREGLAFVFEIGLRLDTNDPAIRNAERIDS